jgi:surfactin synthase thioesterase subunit
MEEQTIKPVVILFPFAGGNKYSFAFLTTYLAAHFDVVTIEYPGRGSRISESLCDDMNTLINDALLQLRSYVDKPYFIYGHSMGALIAFLTVRKIADLCLPPPGHIFLSGCGAPAVRRRERIRHTLPRTEFLAELQTLGGLSKESLDEEDLIDFFEPILRNDFKAIEQFVYQQQAPLNISLTIMIGLQEDVTLEEANAWKDETTEEISVVTFTGHHFFIYDHPHAITQIMSSTSNLKIV